MQKVASSDATCELDLMPTKVLKECLPALAKPIAIIINKCLNSYQPISNLSFLSKVTERIIHSRLQEHLHGCNSISDFQSAYKSGFLHGNCT